MSIDAIRVAPGDPRVTLFTGLSDPQWRMSVEAANGVFIAEGTTVIQRAVDAGLRVRSVLGEEKRIEALLAVVDLPDSEILVADASCMVEIAGYRVHRGALALVERPPPATPVQVIGGGGDLVVLEDLVDPTNVGLVARSAAALGISGMLLSPRCADPLYRRSVRVSMGAVLALPWARLDDWPLGLEALSRSGMALIGLSPEGMDLEEALAGVRDAQGHLPRVALLLGSEGPGLTDDALARCDHRAGIPMAAGVDSLNVAAATAVACFALRSARRRDGMGEGRLP